MKELKIAFLAFAVIVGSWVAITTIRTASVNHALENLTQNALKKEQRMKAEREERERRKEEIRKQEAIEKSKISKESSNECKFWRLQNKNKPTEKAERKIKEYCSQH